MKRTIQKTAASSTIVAALLLACSGVSAAGTYEEPDISLRERSSPSAGTAPRAPGDSVTAAEQRRLARRDRREQMDRPASAGGSSPTPPREVPSYVDGAPAPWSASPY